MPTIEELMKEHYSNPGASVGTTPAPAMDDPRSTLMNDHYGVQPTYTPLQQQSQTPQVQPSVPLPGDPVYSNNLNTEVTPTNGIARLFKEVPRGLARVASEYPDNLNNAIKKHANESLETAGQGFTDIFNKQPASGVGKVLMGGFGTLISPFTGFVEASVDDPVTALTGNERAGKMAGAIATSGLPFIKAANAGIQSLPNNKALRALVASIGPENIAAVVQKVRDNPGMSIMDASPSARIMGQARQSTPGPHQAEFDKFVRDRMQGTGRAVRDAQDAAMGAPVNVYDKLNELKASARKVGKQEIEPALAGTGSVDISPVLQHIQALEKPGVNTVITAGQPLPSTDAVAALVDKRKFLTDGKSQRTDAQSLHQFQAALRSEADSLLNSTDGQSKLRGFALMDMRNKIVDAIDAASPRVKIKDANGNTIEVGAYKQSLSKYRDEMQIQDAFDRGTMLNRNRDTVWEDHPDFVRKWVEGLSDAELEAARQGARVAFDRAIGKRASNPRGLAGTEIATNPEFNYNLEKARLLFGEKEINQMAKRLQVRRDMAETDQKIIQNSKTVETQNASAITPQPKTSADIKHDPITPILMLGELTANFMGGTTGGLITGAHVANKYLGNPVRAKISTVRANRENAAATNLLMATADNDVVLNKLLDYAAKPKTSLRQRASNALIRAVQPLVP